MNFTGRAGQPLFTYELNSGIGRIEELNQIEELRNCGLQAPTLFFLELDPGVADRLLWIGTAGLSLAEKG